MPIHNHIEMQDVERQDETKRNENCHLSISNFNVYIVYKKIVCLLSLASLHFNGKYTLEPMAQVNTIHT